MSSTGFPIQQCNVFVAGEYAMPLLTMAVLFSLYFTKKISSATFSLYFIGILIGLTWELAHAFIPKFIEVNPCISKYMPEKSVYPVIHALHDGFLFLMGYLLVLWVFGAKNINRYPFAVAMFLFTIFVFQEVLVEALFNGRYWLYRTHKYNPVLFKLTDGRVVNLTPVLEWVAASIVFISIMLVVHKKWHTKCWRA